MFLELDPGSYYDLKTFAASLKMNCVVTNKEGLMVTFSFQRTSPPLIRRSIAFSNQFFFIQLKMLLHELFLVQQPEYVLIAFAQDILVLEPGIIKLE